MIPGKVALNVLINEEDSGAQTLRDYFKLMLERIFEEDEGFSGKRPFGNSGWQGGLADLLIKTGIIENEFEYEAMIKKCIEAL